MALPRGHPNVLVTTLLASANFPPGAVPQGTNLSVSS